MSDPLGLLYVSNGLPSPNFHGDIVRNVYSAAGAIAPTDRMSVIDSGTAISLTLPVGTRDGQPLLIKNLGAGTATISATIDGTAGTTTVSSLGALRLFWSAALSTWLSL